MLLCLGPSLPHYHLLSLLQKNYSLLLDSHSDLRNTSSSVAWPVTQFLTIPLHTGIHLQARLLLPPDLDPKKIMAYPIVLNM